MIVTIYSGMTNEIIGKPVVTSMEEACIFLASKFPEHYFGAQLVSSTGSTHLIATKQAFPEGETPIQAAIKLVENKVMSFNHMYDETTDSEGKLYTYWKDITVEQMRNATMPNRME